MNGMGGGGQVKRLWQSYNRDEHGLNDSNKKELGRFKIDTIDLRYSHKVNSLNLVTECIWVGVDKRWSQEIILIWAIQWIVVPHTKAGTFLGDTGVGREKKMIPGLDFEF